LGIAGKTEKMFELSTNDVRAWAISSWNNMGHTENMHPVNQLRVKL